MGFNVKVYISDTFATAAENRALRYLANQLQAVSLPPTDSNNGEGSPLWILVEPHLFTGQETKEARNSRPDLVIIKRNAVVVVEMKHWRGDIVIPSQTSQMNEQWDNRAPGGFTFETRRPNPLQQVRYNRGTLELWLGENAPRLPSTKARASDWTKISEAILFTDARLHIAGDVPEYIAPTLLCSIHGVRHTTHIVHEIACAASGTSGSRANPVPNIQLEEEDIVSMASELGLTHWDPFATPKKWFLGPEGVISNWAPNKRGTDPIQKQPDDELVQKAVQIRLLEFYTRKLIAESHSNPGINLHLDGKSWAKHVTLRNCRETVMSFGQECVLESESIPSAVRTAPELAYGLFWNARTDPDTSFHSASPLFHLGCTLETIDDNNIRVVPHDPANISINLDLLKTFRPFSIMDDDELQDFLREYEDLQGFQRIEHVLAKLIDVPFSIFEPGMEVVSKWAPNQDLIHAAVVFVPEKFITRRLIADLRAIGQQWRSALEQGCTPTDLAWKVLTPDAAIARSSQDDYNSRVVSQLNFEQTAALRLMRDDSVDLVAVIGPPGTGKTRVLATLAADAIASKRTLLLSSTNNTAVSNVINQLSHTLEYPAIFPIGSDKIVKEFQSIIGTFESLAQDETAQHRLTVDAYDMLTAELKTLDEELQQVSSSLAEYYRCIEQLRNVEFDVDTLASQFPVFMNLQVADSSHALEQVLIAETIALRYVELLHGSHSFIGRLVRALNGRIRWLAVFSRSRFLEEARRWLEEQTNQLLDGSWMTLVQRPYVPPLGDTVRLVVKDYIAKVELRGILEKFVADFDEEQVRARSEELQAQRGSICMALLRSRHANRRLEHARAYDTDLATKGTITVETATRFAPIACTLHSLAKQLPTVAGMFDLVAIDEASQCSIGVALPALFRAKKAVVVGDLRQLQPVSTIQDDTLHDLLTECGVDSPDLEMWTNPHSSLQSLVEYHIERGSADTTMRLIDHHRSVPEIIQFSNRTFYNGRLRPRRTSHDPSLSMSWIDVHGQEHDKVNLHEVEEVVRQAMRLLDNGLLPDSLGIITPFSHQREALIEHSKSVFGESLGVSGAEDGVMIDTVHGFQGKERHTIILSPVIAFNSKPGRIGWVTTGPTAASLINVSVTRATDRLIVVGDSRVARGYLGDLRQWIASMSPTDGGTIVS